MISRSLSASERPGQLEFLEHLVDSEANYERIVRFLNRFSPSLVRRVKLYTKETPLFEHFGIQEEISKALCSKSGSRAAARLSSTD